MQITVTIPNELAAKVEEYGLTLESDVREFIEEKLSREHAISEQRRQAVDAMREFAGKHGFTTGGQDLESMGA